MNLMVSERFWAEGVSTALKTNFAVMRKHCSTVRTQVDNICLYFNMFYVL